jgi:hypothetical protein
MQTNQGASTSMHTPFKRTTKLRAVLTAALALTALATLSVTTPEPASASTTQVSILQDTSFLTSPQTALPQARALGARMVRVTISWYRMAPDAASTRKPNFDASDPDAYPASKWAPYDTLVQQARQQGLTVALQITGGAPRWAEGKGAPAVYRRTPDDGWRPNAALYGQFVHAVAERYDGGFKPSGSTATLPAVRFWSFWNEPNFGTDLGPQTTNGSTVPVAPTLYRSLLNSAWKAMQQTGHRHDTLLIGELDPLGNALRQVGHPGPYPGTTRVTAPLSFVRALYCVDANGRRLIGAAAARYSCPTSRAASRRFRAQNPALFGATGFAIHPYSFEQGPSTPSSAVNNNYATFPVLSRLTSALDRATKAYGSGKRYDIYNDEFGYITRPPAAPGFPSQATAATWLNETEYLSYKNRRVASYDQYLINDPTPTRSNPTPGFNTGLYTSSGQPKATLAAFRLPVWLPATTIKAGARTEIWGGARPATVAPVGAPTVEIQMQKGGRGAWTTIQTVKVSRATGYFDIRSKLPYSGKLRLAYTYPQTEPFLPTGVAGSTIYGRTVTVALSG